MLYRIDLRQRGLLMTSFVRSPVGAAGAALALVAGAMSIAVPAEAQSALAENTNGASSESGAYIGQSFSVASGSFTNITFSFLNGSGASATPSATGTLYVFTSPYDGAPNGLSTASGVLASAAASLNDWSFGSTLTLNSGQEYYAYSDSGQRLYDSTYGVYGGGNEYLSAGPASNFASYVNFDANFRIDGTAVPAASAVPEPSSWALMIVGLGVTGFALRRRRTTRVAFAA